MVSASPVRCNINSCGRIATDSSQIENAHRIYGSAGKLLRHRRQLKVAWVTDLSDMIVIGEEDGQHEAGAKQVLDFEGVDVGIVGRFVIVQHEIDGVR